MYIIKIISIQLHGGLIITYDNKYLCLKFIAGIFIAIYILAIQKADVGYIPVVYRPLEFIKYIRHFYPVGIE